MQGRHVALGQLLHGHSSEKRPRLPIILSVAVHATLIAVLLLWSRQQQPPAGGAKSEGAVELVLVEHRGSGSPATPLKPAPPTAFQAPPMPPVPAPPSAVPAPPTPPKPPSPQISEAETAQEPVPTPAPPTPPSQPAQSTPERQAPRISLGGNDETDAVAFGSHVIPASVDAKYHNREPIYPPDAALRAEQGAVILLIHVSPEGLPSGVDVEETSGFTSLDRAARNAVMSWHFVPAVKDGRPIAFDMAFRVVFHLQ